MKREDLNKLNLPDIEKALTDELTEYKNRISNIMDIDELLKEEEALMEESKAYDEYLKTVQYDIPAEIEYDGQTFTKDQICKFIEDAINTLEVEWSATLGIYELIKYWRTINNSISNKVYDSSIRALSQVRYSGFDNCLHGLVINKFLSTCHDLYSYDASWNILISEKHNSILAQGELIRKDNNIISESEVFEVDQN